MSDLFGDSAVSWPLVKLGGYIEILSGFAFDSKAFNDIDGLPLIRIRDVVRGYSNTYFSGTYPDEYIVNNGDLLVGMDGDFNREIWQGGEALLNQRVCKITADGESLDQRYLYHFLPKQLQLINAATPAVTVKHLSVKAIKNIEIPLPPLAEQKRIAAILDKADAIRRKRQQAIKLADEFLRSVFLDMFGDLSGFEGAKVKFGDVVSLDAKMVDPTERDYIDLIHIGPDRIEKETGRLLPALTAREEGLISQKFLFDESYVLYSKIRPYLKKCALAKGIGLCSADMYPIRPIEGKVTREFVWMLLLSNTFSRFTETLPDRASIPKLNRAELASFEFELPHYSMQIKFSNIVKSVSDFQAKGLHGEESKESLFSVLSQKAFSGQL